jgi:hypothetical protein
MRTFEVDFGQGRPAARRYDGTAVKYCLDVVAASPADVVRSVGGWLYDRVRAGWEVNVLLPEPCDSRALQILGMQAAQIPSAASGRATHGLAVSAEMFASDARVRQQVLHALDRWTTEVTLWHDNWPLSIGHRTTTVQHLLSGAARAFKRHALTAAGIADTVGPTETLRSDMKRCLPVDSELIPVGRP